MNLSRIKKRFGIFPGTSVGATMSKTGRAVQCIIRSALAPRCCSTISKYTKTRIHKYTNSQTHGAAQTYNHMRIIWSAAALAAGCIAAVALPVLWAAAAVAVHQAS